MDKFIYDFGNVYIEGAEIRLIDNLCGEFNTNSKDVILKTTNNDDYASFIVELDNGMEFFCEVSYNSITKEWNGVARKSL